METQLKFYDDPPPGPQLLAEELPETKLLMKGISSMTNIDLLAVIINNNKGVNHNLVLSRSILTEFKGDLNSVARASFRDFEKLGATRKQSLSIITSFELSRRKLSDTFIKKVKIKESQNIYDLMKHLADLPHEEFYALFLNRSNEVLQTIKVSQGGVIGTVVDIKIILKSAIENLASNIILCHNHPSGNIEPSEADKQLTTKISKAATMMDIAILDHVIIAGINYYSFVDEGIL